ncbi:serine hydrolase domain-containing protein [Actinokineospora iranica]|uniref:CubicO group peptidase, beta-lactamase class C family n=1 Tax=Actinokineospora iranica TaxID=1271860 RepID=A0A1G6Y5G6_9PSEU|nr:serine hydrolase domain-containing protein [Actinokineospora iranica]SDD85659.1 CubicO group peptidase, beta-lactamase class C family [Actinokineospora iranica]
MPVFTRRKLVTTATAVMLAAGALVASQPGASAWTGTPLGGKWWTGTYPGAEWQRADAAAEGFDPAKLAEIAAAAQADGSNCLVVIRHGRLVGEWYWNGANAGSAQEVFSVTKSVTSTLVGIAQSRRKLDIDDKAAKYIPAWAGTPAAQVTVKNLLSNNSGRHWDMATDYGALPTAADRTALGASLPQDHRPGDVWTYNNAAIQTLDDVLSKSTGVEPADYAEKNLLAPIGMRDTHLTKDPSGNTNMFFGMQSTCEDLARFGHLFLNDGRWNHRQIVPRHWVGQATGKPSQPITSSYGYLWWLNHLGAVADPLVPMTREDSANAPRERMVPNAPADMYWAIGFGGQTVQVDPGSDTVVVRLGPPSLTNKNWPETSARVVTEALVRR